MSYFDWPKFYQAKVKILKKLNGFGDFSLNNLISGKEVIDIGCGSYQYFYDPELAKRRAGIDPSAKAIESANKLYPKSQHIVGSALSLPFENKSFDTALILFMLHHLPEKDWPKVLEEAKRVARESIIILDHHHSLSLIPRFIQKCWWKITDRGETYYSKNQWSQFLENCQIADQKEMGLLFKNVCYYRLLL